jgi:hypothetical protein
MPKPESFRSIVESRAGGMCEYCRLNQTVSGVRFHIEHISPQSFGGETELNNLALSCPGCNLAKSDRTSFEDYAGESQQLFSPRDYEPSLLGWHLHFAIDRESGLIMPLTPVAEATVGCLQMNDSLRISGRKYLIRIGFLP